MNTQTLEASPFGPVATDINRYKGMVLPVLREKLKRQVMSLGLSSEESDQAMSTEEAKADLETSALLAAVIAHLEAEHQKRAAWEKSIEAQLASLKGGGQ